MISKSGVTIFIPVYNEEDLLVKNTMHLLAFLDSLDLPYEVIIGSNGSNDGTVRLAEALRRQYDSVRFFHLASRGGGTGLQGGGQDCCL